MPRVGGQGLDGSLGAVESERVVPLLLDPEIAIEALLQLVGFLVQPLGEVRIIDEERAPKVVRRLLSPALSSGWGIRTLANKQAPYDPIGYHTGSVWPHDNALIAHGMRRYGFDREARRVLDQLALAGAFFPYARFPEVFCGFAADEVPVPVQYPVACRPQAWASGAPLLMIRSYGGFAADAPNGKLYIDRPALPSWLQRIEILGMRVGDARLDLVFSNNDGVTATEIPRKDGDLEILIRQ